MDTTIVKKIELELIWLLLDQKRRLWKNFSLDLPFKLTRDKVSGQVWGFQVCSGVDVAASDKASRSKPRNFLATNSANGHEWRRPAMKNRFGEFLLQSDSCGL